MHFGRMKFDLEWKSEWKEKRAMQGEIVSKELEA